MRIISRENNFPENLKVWITVWPYFELQNSLSQRLENFFRPTHWILASARPLIPLLLEIPLQLHKFQLLPTQTSVVQLQPRSPNYFLSTRDQVLQQLRRDSHQPHRYLSTISIWQCVQNCMHSRMKTVKN
jgi:hypothetical protein